MSDFWLTVENQLHQVLAHRARLALLEDSMPAVRAHLRLLAGLSKCNVKARPGEAGADHEQFFCEVH